MSATVSNIFLTAVLTVATIGIAMASPNHSGEVLAVGGATTGAMTVGMGFMSLRNLYGAGSYQRNAGEVLSGYSNEGGCICAEFADSAGQIHRIYMPRQEAFGFPPPFRPCTKPGGPPPPTREELTAQGKAGDGTQGWYVRRRGKEIGPVSEKEIRYARKVGQFPDSTMVRKAPDGEWVTVDSVPELKERK